MSITNEIQGAEGFLLDAAPVERAALDDLAGDVMRATASLELGNVSLPWRWPMRAWRPNGRTSWASSWARKRDGRRRAPKLLRRNHDATASGAT